MEPARATHAHFVERCGTCGMVIRECPCHRLLPGEDKPVTFTTCDTCAKAFRKSGAQPK